MRIGGHYLGDKRCEFGVWAPFLKKMEVRLIWPTERLIDMEMDKRGYWRIIAEDISPGSRYYYRLDGERDRPDPASSFQPEGVHGPSEVIDHTSFFWGEAEEKWRGVNLDDMIIYETHVGTFTPAGTFEAIIPRLDELGRFGINALELMPVAQFPGERNWGYDGVYPFAVQDSYGGPSKLKELIRECHQRGIAVILDVVYNHFGPEGNYIEEYGPYFSGKYVTPWGKAINYDDVYSDEVRNFFIENALFWFQKYHVDALRLDAIHTIYDMSAVPFLQELGQRVDAFSAKQRKMVYLIAESDLNDTRVIRSRQIGGYGLSAQWCDDFHHAIHSLLTGEKQGYYLDFGHINHLLISLRCGYVYNGQFSAYRNRHFGNSSYDRPGNQFVVFTQNHDQVGNRIFGERLTTLVSFEALKLAAATVFLSPYLPLLFMGEEYGEENHFLYFVSHSDPELIEAVRRGRKEEFKEFGWENEPPDPQSAETFLRSKLSWEKRGRGKHKILVNFYHNLIKLKKKIPALAKPDKNNLELSSFEVERVVALWRWDKDETSYILALFNFNENRVTIPVLWSNGDFKRVIDSSSEIWQGPGSLTPQEIKAPDGEITWTEQITLPGHSFVLYRLLSRQETKDKR